VVMSEERQGLDKVKHTGLNTRHPINVFNAVEFRNIIIIIT